MTRISDLNRNQDLTDGDVFPIGTEDGSTRGVTAKDSAKYFTSEIEPIVDEAKQAALEAQQSAESAEESAAEATAAAGVVGQQAREALRRSYAEAGYNLVAGSFENGGIVASANDVLLYEATGVAYSYSGVLPKVVAPGSSPTPIATGAWVLVGDATLRGDLAAHGGAWLIGFQQAGTGAVPRTVDSKLGESVSAKDFGAKGDGIADDTNALNEFWAYIKTDLISLYPASLPFATKNYVIPPGVYRVTSSVNWTSLQAWNIQIEANGAVIVGEVDNKTIVDALGCRGIHVQGLGVIGHPSFTPKSGILIGPVGTNTCGNNKLSDVKVLGKFSVAALHNIGSETTRHESCYYMNQRGFAMAGDGSNRLGAVSDYQAIRGSGVAVSFTHNAFASCRFENGDKTGTFLDAVYLEATNGWTFDQGCYYLAFDGAGFRIVDMNGVFRTGNLKIDGLFETSQAPGLKYAVRVVVGADSINSALSSSVLSIGRSHAKTAGIRVETVDGAPLVTGSYAFRDCDIKVDEFPNGATKIFDGARLIFVGHIASRYGSAVNVKDLIRGYGTITCDNPATIPATTGNPEVAFACYGEGVLANQGMQMMLGSGTSIGMQGGTSPVVRAMGATTDVDLRLQGQGSGVVRFGTLTTNADAPVTGYITIKDSGGVVRKLAVIS